MLKKITVISALVLAAGLILGLILLPAAVRDTLADSQRIIGEFISSTPVSTFDGKYYSEIHFNLDGAAIYVEQSDDESIYLRAEGLFGERYQFDCSGRVTEGDIVLDVRLDANEAFFTQTRTSYLIWRRLFSSDANVVIVRVPPTVRITTSDPWSITYPSGVRFANREYYDTQEWNQQEKQRAETDRRASDRAAMLNDTYAVQKTAFVTELETLLAQQITQSSPSMEKIAAGVDEIVSQYEQRMLDQLFPYASPVYDTGTLSSLLSSSLMLTGKQYIEKARLDLNYYDDVAMYDEMAAMAGRAANSFAEMYQKYLAQIREDAANAGDIYADKETGQIRIGGDDSSKEYESSEVSEAALSAPTSATEEPAA